MKGSEVFRFVYLRAPEKTEKALRSGNTKTPLSNDLRYKIAAKEANASLYAVADNFLNAPGFQPDVTKLPFFDEFKAIESGIDQDGEISPTTLAAAATNILAEPVGDFVDNIAFNELKATLIDGIIAARLLPDKYPEVLESYAGMYRMAVLLEALVHNGNQLAGVSLKQWKSLHIVLPEDIFPLPEASSEPVTDVPDGDPTGTDSGDTPESLALQSRKIERSIQELLSVHPADLEPDEPEAPLEQDADGNLVEPKASRQQLLVAEYGSKTLLKASAVEELAADAKEVLAQYNLDPVAKPLDFVINKLEKQAAKVAAKVNEYEDNAPTKGLVKVGNTIIPGDYLADKPSSGKGLPQGSGGQDYDYGGPPAKALLSQIRPSGVGSLLIAREHILRYEAGEIAHIENVMQGETKERVTRRLRRTEESIVYESESTKEEERDLQTTERMEMQREVQNTLAESKKWSIGGEISASYGPFIQVNINTDFTAENSSETISRSASSFSKEVIEKTASKITERIREEQTIKTLHEFEENNRHTLDASNSDGHIVGMFRWINRVYQAQVYDYGVRLFFDIMIPEPAKLLLFSKFKSAMESKNAIVPPKPLDIKPSDLNAGNYHKYIRDYKVQGVQPPPKATLTLSKSFSFNNPQLPQEGDSAVSTECEELQIPDGYRAVEGHVKVRGIDASNSNAKPYAKHSISVGIGRHNFAFPYLEYYNSSQLLRSSSLHDEEGSIPVVLLADGLSGFTAQVEVLCLRTTRAMEQWQIATFGAIAEAYNVQLSNYEEKMAVRNAAEANTINGRNPLENRRIERDELKRAAISIITEQHFKDFNAYKPSIPVPKMDFYEAASEGVFARFFEQAFEWENMTHELLPYYWGNRNKWVDTLQIEDPDPEHKAFLRAGFARIRVPVTPEFEAAVFLYLDTGKIWKGGDLPKITNEKHLPFLEEIKKRREEQGPVSEVPIGDSYQYTLPTTLVRVEDGDKLPEWTQTEQGYWVEVENANTP